VSVVTGGVYAGATAEDVARLNRFGRKAGLAFQIVDDVLDMTVDSAHLGKTAGKDAATEKPPAGRLWRRAKPSRCRATRRRGLRRLDPYGSRAFGLKAVARYLIERKN